MKKNLLSIEAAINNAALKETVKEVKPDYKSICLKKFPQEWHDLLIRDNVGNVSEYIYSAVKEKMKRDNLL